MATNTTNTFTNHTGNGTEVNFSISFSYILTSDIDVTVAGVLKTLGTHYTISGSTVTFTSGNVPANGAAIKFQRDTSISTKAVDFQDGSVLTEQDLDNNSNQILFAQQEITDKLSGIEEGATADQTNAEIKTAYEANSDTNAFTDALQTKLNNIESNATADQTNAEIRAAVEAASDSNVFTDADHTKLNNIEDNATADQTVSEIKSLIASSPLDASHLAANSVDTSELADDSVTNNKIADAELKTLAGMQSGTASKLADSTALTSDIADLNQLDGLQKATTITDDDTKFPTSGAIVEYVAAQLAPIGGLEAIANESSFPNTQPASGVVISIADAGGMAVASDGTASGQTVGGTTVNISGIATNFRGASVSAGVRFLVVSTGAGQNYTYHKATLKEDDLVGLSGDINDFGERYRVGSSFPTTNNDSGDLFWHTTLGKLYVYNGTTSAYEETQSIGNFFISTLSPAFDGSTQNFTITNAPTSAQQILLIVEGVLQKPNAGTSTPTEGFALDGSTVKLAAAPATGASYFAVIMGSAVNTGTPSDNTVTTAILQNNSVSTQKVQDEAITLAKLEHGTSSNDGKFLRANNGADPTFETVNTDLVSDTSPQLGGDLQSNGNDIDFADNDKAVFGSDGDMEIYHSGSHSVIRTASGSTGDLNIRSDNNINIGAIKNNGEDYIKCIEDGAVELYHDNVKKLETASGGITVTGTVAATAYTGDGSNLTNLPATGASQADVDDLTNSVALLAFKIAVNGSLARFNLANQVIDEFNDASGIDASASTNEIRNTANKYWVGASANFPTGGNVATYTSGQTNYRVHSFLNTGTTNFVVNNGGTIDILIVGGGGGGGGDNAGGGGGGEVFFIQNKPMTAATYVVSVGAGGSGGSGSNDGSQGTGSYFGSDYATTNLYARAGGGGAGQNGTANDAEGVASTAITGTGNGGGGSVAPDVSSGTPFDATDRTVTAPSGQTYTLSGGTVGGFSEYQSYDMAGGGGGAGGNGRSYMSGGNGVQVDIDGNNYYWGGGGAGGCPTRPVGSWGVGGNGGGGGGGATNYGANGGSGLNAGGNGTTTNGGDGGANTGGGGGGGANGNNTGGDGGSGIVIVRYSADDFQDNVDLTLQSIDATATSAPTKADFVMLYEDGVGTATLNTDIKAFISRDSGTTFTQGTLVAEGDYGSGKKIVAFHDLDISGQPSGTSVCYKVTTHNQGSGKQTRVHAVSHGWA